MSDRRRDQPPGRSATLDNGAIPDYSWEEVGAVATVVRTEPEKSSTLAPDQAPVRVCPSCSAQEVPTGEFCPHCGASYVRTKRRHRSRRAKIALRLVPVIVLLVGIG